MIRAMAGTGRVVTIAGLVFAFTMGSMVASDLRVVGQIGTTIMIGLLFDTLVVRSYMTPALATLLGRWFWWPRRVDRLADNPRCSGLVAPLRSVRNAQRCCSSGTARVVARQVAAHTCANITIAVAPR